MIVTTILESYHIYSWQKLMPSRKTTKKTNYTLGETKRKNRKTATAYLRNQQNCKAHESQFHAQRESKDMCVLDMLYLTLWCIASVT